MNLEDDPHHRGFRVNPILIGLLGVIAGAILVATYHVVSSICLCYRRQIAETSNTSSPNVDQNQQERPRVDHRTRSFSTTPSLIPIYRYSKDCNEDMCAICLGDFKDGEQIRVLPDCFHIFHVACIDTWLNLHSSCPICRADTSQPEQGAVAVTLPGSSRTSALEVSRLSDFDV